MQGLAWELYEVISGFINLKKTHRIVANEVAIEMQH